MAYAKTVLLAIGLCGVILFLRSLLHVFLAVLAISNSGATGIAVSWQGMIETLVSSIVLGWLAGTVWFLIRRWLHSAS